MAYSNLALLTTIGFLFVQAYLELTYAQVVPTRANVSNLVQPAKLGDAALLSCSTNGVPLSVCLWERVSSPERQDKDSNFIVNFNIVTARPGSFSGTDGYTYHGEGLAKGQCGLKIESVREQDFSNWQCTLISNKGIYRGTSELQNAAEDAQDSSNNKNASVSQKGISRLQKQPQGSVSIIQPERESKQFYEFTVGSGGNTGSGSSGSINTGSGSVSNAPGGKARPIITAGSVGDNDYSRSISESDKPVGLQVQEVEVQSAGLQIIQRKGRKLVIL